MGTCPPATRWSFPSTCSGTRSWSASSISSTATGPRARALQVAQLEAQLTRAQLQNLQAQLNPHFLFNALNTVSAVMYEDVARADQVLSTLAELLRRALHGSTRPLVTLAEELEVLELYVEIMRARFGERLRLTLAAEERVQAALVPALVLQPLVENAIRHGAPAPPETAWVQVRAWAEGERLHLTVEDNGPGLAPGEPAPGRGVGLTNTAERLRGLFGEEQSLWLQNRPGGGLRVSVRIPLRLIPQDALARGEVWSGSAC